MSISPRQQVAQNLSDTCVFGGLNDSYGVSMQKEEDKGKSFWSVTFCKARVLDGVLRVYSPNFVLIRWQTGYRDIEGRGSEVFRSERAAKDFIVKNFVRA